MANLFFPQLLTGALAQYPVEKRISTRSIRNILPDGSLVLLPDPDAANIAWKLAFQDLNPQEVAALTGLFSACQGRFRAFTFIDPTDNMLEQSANLLTSPWTWSPGLNITANAPDPMGGAAAFLLTNNAQVDAQLAQALSVPASYQYCFSLYVASSQAAPVRLSRSGPVTQEAEIVATSGQWARVTSSGVLPDGDLGLTVALSIPPGGQVTIFGPQLEAQIVPSRYRPTLSQSAIYPNAHWAVDALPVVAEAPNLYSTAFTIEAMLSAS